tara:strand:+ start:94 stop:1488 length:1395 start_codon:yes stop_codon:yes gene_type:complete
MLAPLMAVVGLRAGCWHGAAGVTRAAAPRCQGFSPVVKERALLDWLEENDVYLSAQSTWGRPAHPMRVEADTVEDFEPSGRGLIARKQILQGEPVLQLNTKLIMTKERAQQELGKSIVPDSMGEYIALALFLMYERSLGERSFWSAYISLLPTTEEVGTSFTWPEEDLALLEGSSVVASSNSLAAKVRREYETLKEDVLDKDPVRFPPEEFPFERFEWAMSMLFSRAINLREADCLALVPYADLLNHSPYSQSYFTTNKITFTKEKEVVLYADRTYSRDDQVLISYGQKSNAELLLLYGFVVDRNLFDEVELSVGLSPEDERYEEKNDFLAQQGLGPRIAFPLLIDRYSSELMQYLRLCCVTSKDGPLDEMAYNERVSQANERAALGVVLDGCYDALDAYPQTEEEDAALMENGRLFVSLSRNQRMAVKLRRNEKRILLRTLRVCEAALQEEERMGVASVGQGV